MKQAFCNGFLAAGISAGIKKTQEKDLGLIYSEIPATVAGVFTRNRVKAAPVVLDQQRIGSGEGRAVIVNSGNANCCTGEQGRADAITMTRLVSNALGVPEDSVLVASTGVIGQILPIEKVEKSIPVLTEAITADGFAAFAEAIMTTDTFTKIHCIRQEMGGGSYSVTGIAKGSGMIRPDMATMLCFVCSDIAIERNVLQNCLAKAVNRSFNRITVDGDTSTNDTVLVMANGVSGVRAVRPDQIENFQQTLDEVLTRLARMIVKDGEGATKMVEIAVKGALDSSDAFKIADTVANSNLVKTALFGEDANWGRIIAAAGRAGVAFDPERIDIRFGDVLMVSDGIAIGAEAETAATAVLQQPEFTIEIDLKAGNAEESVLTCDFSIDYVKINADYRS